MREGVKWLLILGGGFLVARKVFPGVLGGVVDSTGADLEPAVTAPVKELVGAEAVRRGFPTLMNGDQWNWVYQQIRGQEAPDPTVVWPSRDRGFRMTIDEWYAGMSAAGLSGVSNFVRV